jgi:gliding motility-associated-like protein
MKSRGPFSLLALIWLFLFVQFQAIAQPTVTTIRHVSLNQRSSLVTFNGTLSGTSPVADWTVRLNGVTPVTVQSAVVNAAAGTVNVTFTIAGFGGHTAGEPWLKPGETLTVQFTNSGTLKSGGGGTNATSFGASASVNDYTPVCSDIEFLSYGNAAAPDRCSPVNTSFWRWTYRYTLRWRNSSNWVNTGLNQLAVVWNDPSSTVSYISGFLSDASGSPSNNFITNAFSATSDPEALLSFRTSFDPVAGVVDPTQNPFSYPDNTGKCNFNAVSFPFYNIYYGCDFGNNLKSQSFDSFDFDDQNTGTLSMAPTTPPTTATSDQVCLGTNVGVRFTDTSVFNCIGNGSSLPIPAQGAFPSPVNSTQRWVRFIYGGFQSPTPQGNIRDIHVNGTQVTDPTTGALMPGLTANPNITGAYAAVTDTSPNPSPMQDGYVVNGIGGLGTPDAFGVIQLNLPATATTSGLVSSLITTLSTANHAVGQRFYVTLQYWNLCNPYPSANPVEISLDWAEIITKPAPLTAAGLSVCYTSPSAGSNFTVGGVTGGATSINWYKNSNTGVVPIQSSLSVNFPSTSYTIANGFPANYTSADANGAYYSVWATQTVGGTNSCQSDPLEVVIIQQPQIDPTNLPATPTGTTPVCNGDAVVYTEPTAPPNKPIAITHYSNAAAVNLATENFWTHGFGAGTTLTPSAGNATTVTFGISPQPATSTTNNVSVALRYAAANVSVTTNFPAPTTPSSFTYNIATQQCTTTAVNKSVQVFGTSAAGDISPATQTICAGGAIANIISAATVPLPIRGSIIRWEKQVNGGGFATDATLGVVSSINPPVPLVAGAITTYQFRAVYQNGPCSIANGPAATVIVNPRPTSGTLSGTATICAGGTTNLVMTIAGGTTPLYTVVYHSVPTGNVTVANYTSGNNIPISPGATTTYDLVSVTDANGCTATAVAGTPTVTVQNPPAISAQPVSRVICEDATTTFSVTATGTTLTYQWQRDPNTGTYSDITDGVTDGASVYSNATTATLTVNASGTGQTLNNYKYRVIITGVCPPAVTSATPRTLTIQPKAAITAQPVSGPNICINGTKIFSVTATGQATITYQWEVDPDGAGAAPFASVPTVAGDPYTGETTSSLTVNTTGMGTTLNGALYRVVVNSSTCPGSVTSNQVLLTQQGPTTTITQGATGSVCAGNSFPLTGNEVFLNGAGASSVWTGSFDENFGAAPASVVLTNAQLDALLTDGGGGSRRTSLIPIFNSNVAPFVSKVGAFALTLTTTDNNGCTNTATITINVSQVVAAIKYGATAGTISQTDLNAATCSGIDVFLNGNPSGGSGVFAGGLSQHTWTKVSGPGGAIGTLLSATNIQSPIFNATSTGAGADVYVLRYFVQDNVGCNFTTGVATDITITVNPLPAAANQTPAAVCSTAALGITAVVDLTALNTSVNPGSGVTTTITWFTGYNAVTKAFSGSIATPATATVTNATAVFAKVTQNATGCVSPATVTYTVNPRPSPPTGAAGTTYCSATGPIAISVANPGAGLTTDWYAAATGGAVLAGGTGTNSFLPPAAGNYFAETRNAGSGCVSTTRVQVTSTIDNAVAVANAGADQPGKTSCNLPIVLAGNAIAGGAGAWSIPGKVLYYQNFTNFANGDKTSAAANGFTIDTGTPCTTQFPCNPVSPAPAVGFFQVGNSPANPRFEATNTNGSLAAGAPNRGEVVWYSAVVDISGVASVTASLDISNLGLTLGSAGDDNVQVNYKLNGGGELPFTAPAGGTFANSFTTGPASVSGLSGATLQIVVRIRNDAATDKVGIDNVIIKESSVGAITFDNPNLAGASPAGLTVPAAGTAPLTTTFRWTASSTFGVCPNTTDDIDVTINAVPKILAGQTTSVCSGTPVNYEIKLSPTLNFPAGSTLSWPDPDGAGPATAKAALAADPAGTFHITDVLTNTSGASTNVTYVVTPTNSLGCAGTAVNVVVTVLPAPKLNAAQVKTICSGQPVNYQILMTPANAPAGTKFSWPDPDGAGPATAMASINADPAGTFHITDVLTNFTAAPITVTYVVTPTGPGPSNCVGASQNVVITVNPLPVANPIVGQGTVCAGPSVLLYQVTPSAGSSYAWTVPAPFVKFAGGTPADFFVLVQFPAVGTGTIQMTETNSFSCTGSANTLFVTVANAPGALTITGPDPVCKNQAGVNYSVPIGTFNPTSTYNWSASGATITSATSGPGLQTITVDFGLSAAATITVNEVSVSGCSGAPFTKNIAVSNIPTMSSANSESICSGATPTLVFNAAPASTFTWRVTSITGPITATTVPPLAVGKTGTGDLSATFFGANALTNSSAAVGSVAFDVTPATSAAPFCVGPTQNVVITINPKPAIPAQAVTICSGATFTVSPADGVPTAATIVPSSTMYTWPAPVVTGGITGGSAQAVPAASISQTLTNPTNAVQTATYTVTPISGAAGACVGSTFTVTVTVDPKPVIPAQAATVCSGAIFTVTPANGVPTAATIVPAGTTYTWTAPIVTGGMTGGSAQATGQPSISQTLTNPTNSVQTAQYTVTPTSGAAGACIGATFVVTITVNPKPSIPVQTPAICSGTAFTVSPVDGLPTSATIVPAGTTYTWAAPVVTGGITGGSTQAVGQPSISQTLTNPTNTSQTATYTVTPTSGAAGACIGTDFTITVTVNPVPVIPVQASTVCSGNVFTVTPVNGIPTAATIVPASTTYTWTAPVVTGGITGGSAQGVAQASISQTLTNPTNAVQTATYTVTPTSGAAGTCVGATFTVTVTVNPAPFIPAQTPAICSGTAFTVTPVNGNPTAATVVPAGTTYTWAVPVVTGGVTGGSSQAVGQPSISQTLTNPTNTVQTATYTVTPTSGAAGTCVGPTFTITVSVNPKPAIAAQSATICSGAVFTITPADGVPTAATIVPAGTTYTWAAPVVTGGITGGSAQAVGQLSISQTLTNPTNTQQTATYTVTPTSGAAGSCAGSAFTVTITVNPKPVIPSQTATVCSGAAFTVTSADGVPTAATIVPAATTYTWAAPVVTGGITGGSAQAVGQLSISQTLTNPTSTLQTATYTVTPTSGAAGSCPGATFSLTVTVNPKPFIPAQTPIICSGTAFTVSPADGTPTAATIVPLGTTYTWAAPVVTGGITGGSAQAVGQPNISQTLTNPTNTVQTATYTVTPTSGAAGACVGSTFTITVSVNAKPTIPNQTPAICSGAAFTVTPSDGVPTAATIVPAGTTYTWTAPVITGGLTGGTAQGVGQPSISQTLTNPTNAVQTATYTVTPTSGAAGTCVGSTFTITVTVNPKPAIPSQVATVCSGSAFTVSPANGAPTAATIVPAGTTYTWTAPAVTGGLTGGSAQAVGQPNISQTLTNPTNSSQFATYTVTPTSGGCVGATFTVIVSVDAMPTIPAQAATICSGTAFTISPTNSVPTPATIVPGGTTYTWTAPVVTGGITGGSAQAVGQPNISQTLTNPTNTPQTATYTVTPVSGSCTGAPFTITVSVNPKPVIANQTPAICSGTAFTINPANGVPTAATIVPAGTTYTWPAPVVTGGVTGSSAQSNQASISQTLTNPTNVSQTVTYTVTPTSGAAGTCVGSTFTITVTVNPKPFVPAQTPAICSGAAFTVTPADGVPTAATVVPAGTTYTWAAPVVTGGITGGSAQAVGQPSISQTLTNPTNTVQTATYTVTPTSGASGACVGSTFTITVMVNPKPVIAAQTATICSGTVFTVTPTNSVPTAATIVPAGTTYTWSAPVVTGGITGGSAQAAGQTSISQTLTNPTNTVQTATYTVTPTSGAAGACVGATFTVTVTVNPQPFVPAQTPSICSGTAFTVTPGNGVPTAATIVPAGTTYTWAAPVVTGGLLGGSAQAVGQPNISQTLTNPTNSVQTATYTVTPTSGAAGGCVGPNFTITVTVNPKPTIANQTPAICSGAAFTVSPVDGSPTVATIVPAGTTYTWPAPVVTGGITGASAQVGQASISQTLTNPTNVAQTATYTVTPTSGAAGTCVGSTFAITVTVNPKPVIPVQTATICSGGVFTINPSDGVPTAATIVPGGTTYTWTAPLVTGGITGGSAQAVGQPSISQTLTNPTNVNQTATYTVTPTSGAAGSCVGSTFTITVTVNPKPVIPAQTATICSGTSFSINPVDGVPSTATIVPAGTTYTWIAPAVTGGITGGSAQAVGQPLISQTLVNPTNVVQTATYTVTPTSGAAGACVGSTFTITVTVNPTPVISAQASAICSGTAFSVSPSNGTPTAATIVPAGTTYTWPAPVVTGGVTGSSPQTGQSPISQTLTNPTNAVQTVTYTVTPTSGAAGSCVGATFTLVVSVNPKPVIAAQSATICSGTAFTINPANGSPTAATIVPAGTTYTWTAPIVTGGITGGSAQAVGQPSVSQTLTNPTNSVQTATYTVTPTSGAAGACVGSTFTVTVTVNPKPVIPAQAATVCSGTAFTISPVDGVPTVGTVVPPSTTYTWPAPVVTGGLTGGSAQAVGQLNISQTLTNPTNSLQTATYTVTPTSGAAGTCVGSTFTITVTVNPKPIAQALSTIQRCSGAPINFNLQDIINNVPPFAGGNSVASTFTYTVLADFPLDLTPPVFPGSFDRTTASAAVISQTFSNFSSHDVTLTYTVTPFSNIGNCPGTPFTFKVVYHPEPVGQNVTDPGCSSALNHNIQTTQITNGVSSLFTYVVTSSDEVNVPTPAALDRTIATSAPITDTFTNSTNVTVTITYTITPFNAANPSCAGAPFTYKVDIGSKPIGASNSKPVVCSDVAFTIDPQGNITNGVTSTFTWTAIYDAGLTAGGAAPPASGTGVISQTLTNITSTQKNATYTITPTAGPCAGAPFTIIKPVNPEPVMDPALATKTICSTNPTSTNKVSIVLNTNGVSVTAASYNITLKSQDVGLTGTPTTGAALLSTAIQNDTYNNATSLPLRVVYTVVPVSTGGGCLGDPFDITVTVNPEPVLSNLDNTVCSTNISNIVLSTNGTSVAANSYKLISVTVPPGLVANAGNTANGTVSGINLIKNDSYTNSTNGPLIAVYNIRGTSLAGCEGASKTINLTVNPAPVLDPTLNPTPVCSGLTSNVTLGVAAGSVAAATYNINTITFPGLTAGGSNTGIGTAKPASAIFSDVYVNTTNAPLTATYSIAPVSALGCVGPVGTLTLTINPSPAVDDNLNKTVCSAGASGISLATKSTSVAAVNYNIVSRTIQVGLTPGGGNVAVPAANKPTNYLSADVFTNPTNGVLTVTYTVQAVSAAGCIGPQKDIVLTVEPAITTAPINHKATICSTSGSTSDPTDIELISLSVPSAGTITFNYTAVSSLGTQITGFVPSLTNLAAGYHITDNLVNTSNTAVGAFVTYTITPVASGARGGSGCSGTPVNIVVNVEPKPKLVATPTIKTVCEGTLTNISLTSPTTPSVGTIQFLLVNAVATGGVTGASANGSVFANASTLNDNLSNPSTTVQTVTYTLRPRVIGGAGCIGDDVTVTVNVNPKPVLTATPQAPICSGDQIDISLTADVSTTVSTWTASAPATITGAGAGAGDRIFQVLFNGGNIVETVTYTVTPQASGCAGTPLVLTVQVNPKAKVIGVPTTKTVCHGSSLNVPLSSNVAAGVTYAWTVDDPSGLGVPATGSGSSIVQPMVNTLGYQASLTYTITPTGPGPGTGCVGESKIMIVTVAPQITAGFLNSPSPDFICKGSTEYLIFQFGGQPLFNFAYSKGGPDIIVSNKGPVAVIQDVPLVTTTYTIKSVTDGLGCTTPFSVPFTVNVGDTDPNFSIITAAAKCSPNRVSFQYNQVAGTRYTWRWGDSADSVYTATTTVANQVIKHTYVNLSPTSTLNYPVSMQTELEAPYPGCFKSLAPKTVTIYPTILPNVLSDKTEICSGESILFMNQSVGATSQTWSYRVQGQVPETVMGTSVNISQVFTNATSANPIIYEVIYRGTNGFCPAPDQVIPIKVYRSAVAGFNEGVVPPFISGQSIVNFTNTTVPVDGIAFTYDWTFGSDSQPLNFSGTTPGPIKYVRPGPKDVVLTVTNTQRPLCKYTFAKTININLLPLKAEFTASPDESCTPSKITVTSSVITGDEIDWRVYDQNGRVAATSSAPQPIFNLQTEGKYTITLKTSSSLTGQVANAIPKTVSIYPKPFASFDARPDVVYVPDTEVSTFNFSTGANKYAWDFGDGGTSDLEEPTHIYKIEGIYNLKLFAQYDHGNNIVCADTLVRQITAKQGGVTKVPNAFTPNPNGPSGGVSGNGSFNDVFLPIVKGADEFNMQIYDRWGNLIFESNSTQIGWDGYSKEGKLMPSGVYVYKLTIRLSDGQRSTQIGDVTMIR